MRKLSRVFPSVGYVALLAAVSWLATMSPAVAFDTSVCAIATPEGGVEFYGLVSPDPDAARAAAVDGLVAIRGVTKKRASRAIAECIPPGGTFGDAAYQALWEQEPR